MKEKEREEKREERKTKEIKKKERRIGGWIKKRERERDLLLNH